MLGKSDINITSIGLGTWAIGGTWAWAWGEQDDKTSIRTIHAGEIELSVDELQRIADA